MDTNTVDENQAVIGIQNTERTRGSYEVIAGVTRPKTQKDIATIQKAISNWPIDDKDEVTNIKSILNISDCQMLIDDREGVIMVKSPDNSDMNIIILDISNPNDDWAYIPWG